MAAVTVAGTNSQTVSLNFDTNTNAVLAQRLAAAITAGVQAGTIVPAVDTDGPPPPLLPGTTGEFIQTQDGTTFLPQGYAAFVDTASKAAIFGSGDPNESVLIGPSDTTSSVTTFNARGVAGSGTVVAGGGSNTIVIPTTVAGSWSINTGNGDDNILATGSGTDTFFGGPGEAVVHGGTGGNNFLFGGTGATTLFGGGNGDQLVAANSTATQALHAGAGNETLDGGFSRGLDTFYGGTGNATITAGSGNNLFVFTNGEAGGTASIQGFKGGRDQIDLIGYGKNEVAQALKTQTVVGGTDTITLSDHTKIGFANVSSLTASDFGTGALPTVGGAGGTGGQSDDGQQGHGHQSLGNMDDPAQIRDSMLKNS